MLWCILIVLTLVKLLKGGPFDPTPDEINRKLVVPAPRDWGHQARHEKSLRILCIGGSNTAPNNDGFDHDVHYVYYLDQYVRYNMTNHLLFNRSFALNRGVSGQGPEHFVGKKFDFEFQDKDLWPNVVVLEFAVNMPALRITTHNQSLLYLEQLIHSIAFKYKRVNLPRPDFLFYNVDHTLQLVLASLTLSNYTDRLNFVEHYWEIPGINMSDHIIKEFTQAYHIPLISWGDVVTPAAFRFFLNHTTRYYDEPWAYSREGIHVKGPFGSMFAVNVLLGPFLQDAMATASPPGASDVPPSRLFPPSNILMEIASFSTYGRPLTTYDLRDIVHDLNHSDWQARDFPHVMYCFGSEIRGAVADLRFHVPPACNVDYRCQVQITMMRSGNSSRIGNSTCSLHRHNAAPEPMGTPLQINGQAVVMPWQTYAVTDTFDSNVTEGKYSVRCVNLFAERLSCMTSLSINSVVMV